MKETHLLNGVFSLLGSCRKYGQSKDNELQQNMRHEKKPGVLKKL